MLWLDAERPLWLALAAAAFGSGAEGAVQSFYDSRAEFDKQLTEPLNRTADALDELARKRGIA